MHKESKDYSVRYAQLEYPNVHCERLVLHSPGICIYCDKEPEEQKRRIILSIQFTDEVDIRDHRAPCPAIAARGKTSVNRWYGNVSKSE